ncbi:MAG: ATP-binding cassette domain-containing protein [Deltaproteobacteria bacterium]|nr:ATP-binding cassette domain-containing protein [Deltaproteobacteria bacterium]
MISVKKLRKAYGDVLAVQNVSFEVAKGEVVGFLGPNGAGKTTTIKMLTCYMAPTSGTAAIAGHDILRDPLAVRQTIGYLPENAPLYAEMRVFEYLKWVGEVRGFRGDELRRRMRRAVDLCALEKVIGRTIGELSKGYRQRVGLAHALLHDPDVLILDEPWSGLDPNQIVESRDLIRRIGENKTIVLSTHILTEVEATCSRAIIINAGQVVADSTPKQLRASARGDAVVVARIDLGATEVTADEAVDKMRRIVGVRDARMRLGETGSNGSHATGRVLDVELSAEGSAGLGALGHSLAERVIAEKWMLVELRSQVPTLEEVFRQLTGARSAPTIRG